MSYPFTPNPTYDDVMAVLKRHRVQLCQVPGRGMLNVRTGQRVKLSYLHNSAYGVCGIPMGKKAELITWFKLRAICEFFAIQPDEFGLTAGWPV